MPPELYGNFLGDLPDKLLINAAAHQYKDVVTKVLADLSDNLAAALFKDQIVKYSLSDIADMILDAMTTEALRVAVKQEQP